MEYKRIAVIFTIVVVLMLIPFLAGADWNAFDYFAMGMLLSVTGLLFEIIRSTVKIRILRFIIFGFLLLAFFLVCAELSVGIFDTYFAGS